MNSINFKKYFFIVPLFFLLLGCVATQTITDAIESYELKAGQVSLGDTKEQVLNILIPTQLNLSSQFSKPPEKYIENDKIKEIFFFRSRSFADGIVTDDEFMPYIFEDNILVAIGWTAIGGPKTQAQPHNTEPKIHLRGGFFFH